MSLLIQVINTIQKFYQPNVLCYICEMYPCVLIRQLHKKYRSQTLRDLLNLYIRVLHFTVSLER